MESIFSSSARHPCVQDRVLKTAAAIARKSLLQLPPCANIRNSLTPSDHGFGVTSFILTVKDSKEFLNESLIHSDLRHSKLNKEVSAFFVAELG